MISEDILKKLSMEELSTLKLKVDTAFVEKKAVLGNEIRFSDVSERCKSILEEHQITTWNQLATYFTEEDIRHFRNCSSKTVVEILGQLRHRGLSLKAE